MLSDYARPTTRLLSAIIGERIVGVFTCARKGHLYLVLESGAALVVGPGPNNELPQCDYVGADVVAREVAERRRAIKTQLVLLRNLPGSEE